MIWFWSTTLILYVLTAVRRYRSMHQGIKQYADTKTANLVRRKVMWWAALWPLPIKFVFPKQRKWITKKELTRYECNKFFGGRHFRRTVRGSDRTRLDRFGRSVRSLFTNRGEAGSASGDLDGGDQGWGPTEQDTGAQPGGR